MRSSFAIIAAAAGLVVANPVPQAVTSAISPSSSAPAGCSPNYSGTFEIQVVNVTSSSKRSVQKRQDSALVLTLQGGVLHDADGRTGYIAANNQFQFDGPPQAGAIYTAGFSVCSNGSLAIGDDAIFYQCLSGTFYNLYDNNDAGQCSPVYIQAIGGSAATAGVASQTSDGQVTASPTSGQVSQYTDGQPQETPVSSAVCEYTDGQPQVTGCVTQISDGQPQAPTATAAPVSQISDGQPQAPTATAAPVTQISDGQPQAPTATAAPCTEYKDGQPQCSTAASAAPSASYGANSTVSTPTPSPVAATGAASSFGVSSAVSALIIAVAAVAML